MFLIRQAKSDDRDGIDEVFTEMYVLHREVLPDVFPEPDLSQTTTNAAVIAKDENAAQFVAENSAAKQPTVKCGSHCSERLDRPSHR